MFGRFMNNYYYGKSGKGDFKKDDLPENRFQLFFEMLRIRLSGLCRLNLMTVLAFLPLIVLLLLNVFTAVEGLNSQMLMRETLDGAGVTLEAGYTREDLDAYIEEGVRVLTEKEYDSYSISMWKQYCTPTGIRDFIGGMLFSLMLFMIPCILITGPVEAGIAYITRNWSRDEHAFIWSDFKDAVKENWKQGLGVSAITSVLPMIIYVGWTFYSDQSSKNLIFIVPQMLVLMIGVIWILGLTFMYPMMVSYKVTFRELLKNSLMLGVARLPQTVGVNLLHLIPTAITFVLLLFTTIGHYALIVLVFYYIILGIVLARFINASLANAVFDRFINSRIEGAKINRGLRQDDDEDEDDDEDAEAEGAAAESGETEKEKNNR